MQQSIMAKNISRGLEKHLMEVIAIENELVIKEKAWQRLSDIKEHEKSLFLPDHLEFGCEEGVQISFIAEGKPIKYEIVVVKRVP